MLADEAPLELVITHWPQPANAVNDALNRLKASIEKPLSPYLQQALAFALVLQGRLSPVAPRRPRTEGRPPQAAEVGWREFD